MTRVINKKDVQAFDQLYLRYQPFVKSIIASHVKSADREDLLQDVFMKIWDNKGTYDPTQVAKAYIRGLVKNLISLYFRNQNNQVKPISIESLDFPENLAFDLKLENAEQFSQTDIETLRHLTTQLPSKAKQAFTLKYIDGLSTKDAAKQVGCTTNAFNQRINRSHRIIKKLIAGFEGEQRNLKKITATTGY